MYTAAGMNTNRHDQQFRHRNTMQKYVDTVKSTLKYIIFRFYGYSLARAIPRIDIIA